MGALESKRWQELGSETPTKETDKDNITSASQELMIDPRSPLIYHQRTPIVLQEYEESPRNIALRAEFCDPRSPSVEIMRTPLTIASRSVVVVDQAKEEDVFESKSRSTEKSDSPTPITAKMAEAEMNSPGAPLTRKDKVSLLKSTASPGDYKRKNRVQRRQSLPQKLFSDSKSALPRSPLAQRHNSVHGEDLNSGKKKRFTIMSKKKSFLREDFNDDKENATMPIVH